MCTKPSLPDLVEFLWLNLYIEEVSPHCTDELGGITAGYTDVLARCWPPFMDQCLGGLQYQPGTLGSDLVTQGEYCSVRLPCLVFVYIKQ